MNGKRNVCFTLPSRRPGQGDGFGVLEAEYRDVAAAFGRRGWEPVLLRIGEPDFWRKLLRLGSNPANLIFFGHFFYDAAIGASFSDSPVPLGDLLEAKVAAYLGDHPFSSFMLDRVLGLPQDATVFLFEPDFAQQIRLFRPEAKRLAALPGLAFGLPDARPAPAAQRPFDLLIPLRWKAGRDLSAILEPVVHPGLRRAFEAVYEATCHDLNGSIFECFLRSLNAEAGLDFPTLFRADLPSARRLLDMLTAVDFCMRDARRRSLVQALLADTGGRKVCVIGNDVREICPDAEVTQFGPVSFEELTKAMGMARMVAHSQPTYAHALHERFLNAAASASVPVCEDAPAWRETFAAGREWIAAGDRSLAAIAEAFDPVRLGEMGQAARSACFAEYSVDRHVDRILEAVGMEPRSGGLATSLL